MTKRIYTLIIMIASLFGSAHALSMETTGEIMAEEKSLLQEKSNTNIDLPTDVKQLLKKADECTYWINEWNPDINDSDKSMVEGKINAICLEVLDQRTDLLDKYSAQPEILQHLN